MQEGSRRTDALKDRLAAAEERASAAEAALAATEAKLREESARYRLLIESWTQAVWETDADGVVVTDSPSWRAYTGQTLEQWLGYGWLDAVHPDDRAFAEAQWRTAAASRSLVNAEFRLLTRDGAWRWTNVLAVPVLDDSGAIEKWVGINIDIDARKHAQAASRASEEKYRALFERMDEAYAVVEVLKSAAGRWADFRFLDANPAFMEHTSMPYPVGKTATELLGKPNPRWAELYGDALDTGVPIRLEETEHTLGQIFDLNIFALDREHVRAAIVAPLAKGGWLVAEFGVHCVEARDWTDAEVALVQEVAERTWAAVERSRAEAALRESEERLRLALEVGGLAAWDWDVRTGATQWSDAHYPMQGYAVGEVVPSYRA